MTAQTPVRAGLQTEDPLQDLALHFSNYRTGNTRPPMAGDEWTVTPVTPGSADPRFAALDCLFFGIGAQKSATTWVASYLADHPDVHIPSIKELHYWDTVRLPFFGMHFAKAAEWRNRRGTIGNFLRRHVGGADRKKRSRFWSSWYKALASGGQPPHSEYADALLEGRTDQKVAGEITPSYALLEEESFADMAALSSNARFFFIMRDPLDRLKSSIRFHIKLSTGRPAQTDQFNAVLREVLDTDFGYIFERSCYLRTIERLESAVPRDRIAYFFYETLFDQAEVDRLTDFLGIGRRAADFGVVHGGASGGIQPDHALWARAAERLAVQYTELEKRLGPLPWRSAGAQSRQAQGEAGDLA